MLAVLQYVNVGLLHLGLVQSYAVPIFSVLSVYPGNI